MSRRYATLRGIMRALTLGAGRRVRYCRQPSQVEHRISLAYSPLAHALCTFDSYDRLDEKPARLGRAFQPERFASMPKDMQAVATALGKLGFRVIAPADSAAAMDLFHRHSLRNVVLVRGRRLFPGDRKRRAVTGVTVTLSYVVSP